MFEPRTIALIGATERSFWTHLVTRNYAELGFAGRAFAVNRRGADVFGLPGFTSCTKIGEPVDVAFVLLPQNAVYDALDDIAAAGIAHAVVLAAGYAEIPGEGAARQAALVARARELGITLWGPNSLGFNNVGHRLPVSAISVVQPVLPPAIAIVTQSGASAIEINEFAHSQNIGSSFVAATGNEAMVGIADLVDYLVDHAHTKAIAIFAETIRDPVGFIRAAERARAAHKPIVIMKIGRSALAGAVARAHTGSIVGDDHVFDAMCERLGVVRVDSAEDLVITAGLLAATGPLTVPGVAFVSTSGGACTIFADGAEAAGVELPPFPADVVQELRNILPEFGSTLNPLDITGAMMSEPDLFERILPHVARAPGVGLLVVNLIIPTMEGQGFPPALDPLSRGIAAAATPTVIVTMTNKALNDMSREVIARHGLPHVVTGLDPMLRAISRLCWWSRQVRAAVLTPAIAAASTARPPDVTAKNVPAGPAITGERALMDILAAAGVPVVPGTICATRAEVERVTAAGDAAPDGTLVLKIVSDDIAHKTEAGGVRLDVAPDQAGAAFDAMLADVRAKRPDARIDGAVVSPMRRGGLELLVSVTRDPAWGQMLTIGFGGVLVELLADVVVEPLPVDRARVRAMLGRLRGARLLAGYRGSAPADLDAVADTILAIAGAATMMSDNLAALEINPLYVDGHHVEALDALASWDDPVVPVVGSTMENGR